MPLAIVEVELARELKTRATARRVTMQSIMRGTERQARCSHSRPAGGWFSMTRGIGIVILFGALALGGCASAFDDQPDSWAFTPEGQCARTGNRDGASCRR